MRLILFFKNLLLLLSLICEDIKRPKKREDCFVRSFVGEYNETNAYCCYLQFNKLNWKTLKCSVHFKKEIDNDTIFSTIEFLKAMNSQPKFPSLGEKEEENENEIEDISLDCNSKYINNLKMIINVLIFILI